MIRILPESDLNASPSPTALDPEQEIELRLLGVYSTNPPETAVFEYTSERGDVQIKGGEPARVEKKISWDEGGLVEVKHSIVLRKAPGTDPPLAPILLVVRGPSGETPRRGAVVELETEGGD